MNGNAGLFERQLSQSGGLRRGFTILEILIAVALLALLTLLIAQMTSGASAVTGDSHRRMDGEGQARLVLDRLSLDFSRMVKRNDVDLAFTKSAGNDSMSFYCETSGHQAAGSPASSRRLAVVGYRVNPSNGDDANMLARGARSIGWNDMTFSSLVGGVQTQSLEPPNSLPDVELGGGGATNYDVLGNQVFRFELSYLTRGSADTPATLTRTAPARLSDIAAVVVAIAVLDERSQKLIQPAQLAQLANAFPDAEKGKETASLWAAVVGNTTALAAAAGVPATVASSVRIYQRYFYLPPAK